ARRRPPQGLLHHSDRGSQYASGDYQRVLSQHGIVCSMSRRGECWDNAVAESFFATLKVELVHNAAWATRAVARTELFEYLELFYNVQRRHSALGYLSPRAFEQRLDHEALAAQPRCLRNRGKSIELLDLHTYRAYHAQGGTEEPFLRRFW